MGGFYHAGAPGSAGRPPRPSRWQLTGPRPRAYESAMRTTLVALSSILVAAPALAQPAPAGGGVVVEQASEEDLGAPSRDNASGASEAPPATPPEEEATATASPATEAPPIGCRTSVTATRSGCARRSARATASPSPTRRGGDLRARGQPGRQDALLRGHAGVHGPRPVVRADGRPRGVGVDAPRARGGVDRRADRTRPLVLGSDPRVPGPTSRVKFFLGAASCTTSRRPVRSRRTT